MSRHTSERIALSLTSVVRVALVATTALLLAACATGPQYLAPNMPAPATWHADLPHGGQVSAMRDWWNQFDDPAVARLISLAEANSPDLKKAWAGIEKARATVVTARAAGLPSVDGSASVSRARQQAQPGTVSVGTTRSVGADASWEVDLFAKARRGTEAARARVDARTADWHDARVSLAAEVADTYVQYRACQQLTERYERELQSNEETEDATAVAVRAGFNPMSDQALAEASVASAESTLQQQRSECELLVESLVYLTGVDGVALRDLLRTWEAVGMPSRFVVPEPKWLVVSAVPAQALQQRPDLSSLERELAASTEEIGQAQADLYPSLSLSGSITLSASSGASALSTWSFGPSLSIPLFDSGRRRAAVDTAWSSYWIARANYEKGVRSAVKEVEQALINLCGAQQRSEFAERAERGYASYFRATEAKWHSGTESLLTLEEARRSALSSEINLITLQRDRVEYWIALYKALGGGWEPGTPASSSGGALEDSKKEQ